MDKITVNSLNTNKAPYGLLNQPKESYYKRLSHHKKKEEPKEEPAWTSKTFTPVYTALGILATTIGGLYLSKNKILRNPSNFCVKLRERLANFMDTPKYQILKIKDDMRLGREFDYNTVYRILNHNGHDPEIMEMMDIAYKLFAHKKDRTPAQTRLLRICAFDLTDPIWHQTQLPNGKNGLQMFPEFIIALTSSGIDELRNTVDRIIPAIANKEGNLDDRFYCLLELVKNDIFDMSQYDMVRKHIFEDKTMDALTKLVYIRGLQEERPNYYPLNFIKEFLIAGTKAEPHYWEILKETYRELIRIPEKFRAETELWLENPALVIPKKIKLCDRL